MSEQIVLNFFCDVLKLQDKMHCSMLMKRLQSSTSVERAFFDSYSDFHRRWFFDLHTTHFIVTDDGCVSLTDEAKAFVTSKIQRTFVGRDGKSEISLRQSENLVSKPNNLTEGAVIDCLISILSENGPMHYLALTKYPTANAQVNIVKYFKNFSLLEKFLFFKNRPSCFKIVFEDHVDHSNSVHVSKTEKEKRYEVAEYFTSILQFTFKMNPRELVKCLQESNLGVKNYFSSFSDAEVRMFFEQHHSQFQLHSIPYVSLSKESEADADQVTQGKVNSAVINNTRKNENLYKNKNGRHILYSKLLNDSTVKCVISALMECGSMHCNALQHFVGNRNFKQLSTAEKIACLTQYTDSLIVEEDGYVLLNYENPKILEEEKKARKDWVVDFFVSILNIYHRIHLSEVKKHLYNSRLRIKDYFHGFSEDEIYNFFTAHHSVFLVKQSYISLQFHNDCSVKSSNFSSANKPQNQQTTKENASFVNEQCKYRFSDTTPDSMNVIGKTVLDKLVDALWKYGSMHYLALIKCASYNCRGKELKQLELCKTDLLFIDHLNLFKINNDGCVTLTESVLSMKKLEEAEVIGCFTALLRTIPKMHPFALVSQLQNSSLNSRRYFFNFSRWDLNNFFTDHASHFIFQYEITVSLHEEVITSIKRKRDFNRIRSSGTYLNKSKVGEVEEQLISCFTAVLKERGQVHYLELVDSLPSFSLRMKNYFKGFSDFDLYQFFKMHSHQFVIQQDGYVSLKQGKTEANISQTDEVENMPAMERLDMCEENELNDSTSSFVPTSQFIESGSFTSHQEGEKQDENGIKFRSMKRHAVNSAKEELMVDVRTFGPIVAAENSKSSGMLHTNEDSGSSDEVEYDTKSVVNSHTSINVPPQENIIKNKVPKRNSDHMQPSGKNVKKRKLGKTKEKIIGYFTSVLKDMGRVHYLELVNCLKNYNLKVSAYFKDYSDTKLKDFFKHASEFVFDLDSYVSLKPEEREGHIKKETDEGGNRSPSGNEEKELINSNLSSADLPTSQFIKSGSPISQQHRRGIKHSPEEDATVSAIDSAEEILLKENILVLSLTDTHMQSIKYFAIILKDRRTIHFHKLLFEACRYDRCTHDFLTKFALADLLVFIQMHSMYFSIQEDGYVTLVDSSIVPSKIFTVADHVIQVTSAMHAKAVEFYVNLLHQRIKIPLSELKLYLGFAPAYILSFFTANYRDDDFFKFFLQCPDSFHICGNKYIKLR